MSSSSRQAAALTPPANEEKYPDPNMFGALPATGLFIRNARNIDISHIDVMTHTTDARPGVWMQDVEAFDGSFLNLPDAASSFQIDRVSQFRTFGSRNVPDKRFDTMTTTNF